MLKTGYKSLQKKAKKTERQEKASDIARKDGTTKKVYKYKRKKRFGKSLNSRSPALFLSLLEHKALALGGSFEKVKTRSYKASQYDHTTGRYVKIPLSQRGKVVGGHEVQRDLYSAFLIRNSNDTYDSVLDCNLALTGSENVHDLYPSLSLENIDHNSNFAHRF